MPQSTSARGERLIDVAVIGGGMAALAAAIESARSGAVTHLFEAEPQAFRGGNMRHVRNCRAAHAKRSAYFDDLYPAAEFACETREAYGGALEETLVREVSVSSLELCGWLRHLKVPILELSSSLTRSRRTFYFKGGGKNALASLFRAAARYGVSIHYESALHTFEDTGRHLFRLTLAQRGQPSFFSARSIVFCSGGYQSDRAMLAQDWGRFGTDFTLRGRPNGSGRLISCLFDFGAKEVGNGIDAHLVAVDARGPSEDGGIVTRVEDVGNGPVLDRNGNMIELPSAPHGKARFSAWGKAIAHSPGQIAYFIRKNEGFRSAPDHLGLQDSVRPVAVPSAVAKSQFHDAGRDRIIPLRPGISFTTRGPTIDARARIVSKEGLPIPGLYAAGMICAGNLIGKRYLSGMASCFSAVTGRIAGREAAAHAVSA